MAKKNTVYICSNCGASSPKWAGQCSTCHEWNTLEEEVLIKAESSMTRSAKKLELKGFNEIELSDLKRISSGYSEFDRVLGGEKTQQGFVKGEVALISGDPGIGKSTLLLQVLSNLANKGYKVLYVSAEESEQQIAIRANRVLAKIPDKDNFKIVSSYDLDAILETLANEVPDFVVIDSIQTVSTSQVRGLAGGISQIKASTINLVNFAKENNVTMLIVGHINKEGNVAGPKVLEHLVDAVFQIEGEEKSGYRVIRGLKNRFGTTNEVGILGLEDKGIVDIKDASSYFVSSDSAPGVSRSAILEGNRVLVVEIQALTNNSFYSMPKRIAEGVSLSKVQVIAAILERHAKLRLSDKDIYVNIAGGLKVRDPSIDLAIAMAIASSLKGAVLDANTAILGELSLTGRVGSVSRVETRKKELTRLGYKNVIDSHTVSNIGRISSILGKK